MEAFFRQTETEEAQAQRQQGRQVYGRLAWGLVLLLLGQTLFPLVLFALLRAFAPWVQMDTNVRLLVVYGCMYLLSFPLLCLLWGGLPDRLPSCLPALEKPMGAGHFLGMYAAVMALANLVLWLLSALAAFFGGSTEESLRELGQSTAHPGLLFVLAVIVAPVMEELVFRYLPYRKAAGYGMRYFVIWTALSFGLFHLNVVQGAYACAMGALFAIVMYRTGDVRYSIGLHMLVNASSAMGLGGLVLRQDSELLTMLYGLFQLLVFLVGIVMLVRYGMQKWFDLTGVRERADLQSWRRAFFTPGYLCFLVGCLLCMLL